MSRLEDVQNIIRAYSHPYCDMSRTEQEQLLRSIALSLAMIVDVLNGGDADAD